MKNIFSKTVKIILTVLMITMLPGIGRIVKADETSKTYDVTFTANGNSITKTVSLSHKFSCDYKNENGELDEIIQGLYGMTEKGCCEDIDGEKPSVSEGEGKVSIGFDKVQITNPDILVSNLFITVS